MYSRIKLRSANWVCDILQIMIPIKLGLLMDFSNVIWCLCSSSLINYACAIFMDALFAYIILLTETIDVYMPSPKHFQTCMIQLLN